MKCSIFDCGFEAVKNVSLLDVKFGYCIKHIPFIDRLILKKTTKHLNVCYGILTPSD